MPLSGNDSILEMSYISWVREEEEGKATKWPFICISVSFAKETFQGNSYIIQTYWNSYWYRETLDMFIVKTKLSDSSIF